MILTGRQIVEARALLGLSRDDLAGRAGVSGPRSLKRLESFDQIPLNARRHAVAIQGALERAGAEFFIDGEGAPAVRLREPAP